MGYRRRREVRGEKRGVGVAGRGEGEEHLRLGTNRRMREKRAAGSKRIV